MKKVMKRTVLGVLLLAAMTLCSAAVLCIFQVVFKIDVENILSEGFQVAIAALGILAAGWALNRMRT